MQQAQQLGRYHLLDRIAFGGMAEIYRAKTADAAGRLHLMAVKRVLAHLVEDEEFIHMLIDEARLTALLKHPNIARIYEFCKTTSEYFISMEYVDGKDLRALLEKARQAQEFIPEEHLAYICMLVARGLHFAHHLTDRAGVPLNIVHRDVSPSNVLISYAGEVKLCDFGIAKAAGARSQTKTGVIKGKVKYMSPEQAMGKKLDGRSDLFSLGTLLYEMVALAAPFHAQTEIELLFAVRDARKRPIRELRPHISSGLEIIIERAMAKQKERRFQDGEEFAESLRAFLLERYPGYGPAQLSRYMLTMFAREREREQKTLDDFVITPGRQEAFGENLLADVMGPDAEYTQFTAAFGEKLSPAELEASAPLPNPMQQMRVMSSVSMPELLDADEIADEPADELDVPTFQRPRVSATELGLMEPRPATASPSAQTMPRGGGQASAKTAPPAQRGLPLSGLPSGNETAILTRDTPGMPSLPGLHSESTYIVGDSAPEPALHDDELHAQQTHILSRDVVEAMLAKRLGRPVSGPSSAPQPLAAPQIAASLFQPQPPAGRAGSPSSLMPQVQSPPLAPQSLADDSDLHAASTQILSFDSLPANIRDVLQRRAPQPAAPAPQVLVSSPIAQTMPAPPVPSPVPPPPVVAPPTPPAAPPSWPSVSLQTLDVDLQEMMPAGLEWSPLEHAPHGELPAPPDPSLVQPARPLAPRSSTGAQAPISVTPPRSSTGAQAPISATPRSSTGAQAPISVTPPRSSTGAQAPISATPRSSTGAQAPISVMPPRSSTGAQAPISQTPPRGAAEGGSASPPARSPTQGLQPIAVPARGAASTDPLSASPAAAKSAPPLQGARASSEGPPRKTTPPDTSSEPPTWNSGPPRIVTPIAPEPTPPRRQTAAQVPITPPPAAAPPRIAVPVGGRASTSAPPSDARPAQSPAAATTIEPAPPIAAPAAVVMAPDTGGDEEWESLPHLDSTMMARGGELPIPPRPLTPAAPRQVAPVRPVASRAVTPAAPAVEDYPTIPPSSLMPSGARGFDEDGPPTSEQKAEPITDASLTAPPALSQGPAKAAAAAAAEEPVTNPKSGQAWQPARPSGFDDLGIDTSSDFAEDTDKGGGPKGFGGAAAQDVDPAPYLTGGSAPASRTLDVLNKLGKAKGSSPRVPTSGGRPGAWDGLPRKK
jgi:serine/threonine-protein kinase